MGLAYFGQNCRVAFTGGSFHKGVAVPIDVLRGQVWGRVQVGGGVPFSFGA